MSIVTTAQVEWMFRQSEGVLIQFGTLQTYGHLDVVDDALFPDARMVGATMTLAYPTGKLSGLTTDSRVSVDGTSYDVRQVLRRADGTSVALLSEV